MGQPEAEASVATGDSEVSGASLLEASASGVLHAAGTVDSTRMRKMLPGRAGAREMERRRALEQIAAQDDPVGKEEKDKEAQWEQEEKAKAELRKNPLEY